MDDNRISSHFDRNLQRSKSYILTRSRSRNTNIDGSEHSSNRAMAVVMVWRGASRKD